MSSPPDITLMACNGIAKRLAINDLIFARSSVYAKRENASRDTSIRFRTIDCREQDLKLIIPPWYMHLIRMQSSRLQQDDLLSQAMRHTRIAHLARGTR
jgi:hypothetical protein